MQKNTRYSLRAYAKFLGLHSSALSRVMSGKLELTSESGVKIAKRLKLSEDETRLFIHSILRSRGARELLKVAALLDIELDPASIRADFETIVSIEPAKLPHAHQKIQDFVETLKRDFATRDRAQTHRLRISFSPVLNTES